MRTERRRLLWAAIGVAVVAFPVVGAWGCVTVVDHALDDLEMPAPPGVPAHIRLVEHGAPSLVPEAPDDLTEGDYVVMSYRGFGGGGGRDGTYVVALDGGRAGAPMRVLGVSASGLSPGGHYISRYDTSSRLHVIARLADGRIVAYLQAHSWAFTADHELVLFGSEDGYRHGEAIVADLERATTRELPTTGLTMSVRPIYKLGGEVGLCEERDDGGSGPFCVSNRLLDLETGETRALPDDPAPTVSDDGVYLFTETGPGRLFGSTLASRRVGDEVVYWERDGADGDLWTSVLRRGGLEGPRDDDASGATVLPDTYRIWATPDEAWIVTDSSPTGGETGFSVCDVESLTCSDLGPGGTEWSVLGVVPSTALER